MLYNLANTFTC